MQRVVGDGRPRSSRHHCVSDSNRARLHIQTLSIFRSSSRPVSSAGDDVAVRSSSSDGTYGNEKSWVQSNQFLLSVLFMGKTDVHIMGGTVFALFLRLLQT